MNKDKVPFVTTLLRASRSQDEDTLRQVLENILRNGMNETELNAEDCSGRVSDYNYLCDDGGSSGANFSVRNTVAVTSETFADSIQITH